MQFQRNKAESRVKKGHFPNYRERSRSFEAPTGAHFRR